MATPQEFLSTYDTEMEGACRDLLKLNPPDWAVYAMFYVEFTGEFDEMLPIGFTWSDSEHGAETVYPSPLTKVQITPPSSSLDFDDTLKAIFEWISANWNRVGGANSKIPFLIYDHSSMDTFSAVTLEEYDQDQLDRIAAA